MSAMTLEQVRNWLANCAESCTKSSDISNEWCGEMANAIDAHLTAHTQMVEKVREIVRVLWISDPDLGDKLAAAIGDAK